MIVLIIFIFLYCREEDPRIADIFVKKGPFLQMYTTYISNFQSMTSELDQAFKDYPMFADALQEFEVSHMNSSPTNHVIMCPSTTGVVRLPITTIKHCKLQFSLHENDEFVDMWIMNWGVFSCTLSINISISAWL